MQARQGLTRLREKLQKQITLLESEMATLEKAIQLLERENTAGGTGPDRDKRFAKAGLSETVRQVVGSEWISPTEVRDHMMRGGFKNENKSKLLAAVFATMKRLGKGEFEVKKLDGKLKYRTKQPATTNSEAAA